MSALASAIKPLFDSVFVLSLQDSIDRRKHIRNHFQEIGLGEYTLFDAFARDASEVSAAFEAGEVFTYPPCFRCGQIECGQVVCNNVLIRPQVANFLSYRRLWQHIAAKPQRALIVEDDVCPTRRS